MAVTARDLAERLGLSRESVVQILAGRGKYRSETRERVLQAAADMGYRPNAAARAIRLRRHGAIGVVSSTEAGRAGLDMMLLLGIEYASRGRQHLVFSRLDDAALTREETMRASVAEWNVDGLLIAYAACIPAGLQDLLVRARIPAIWLNVRHATDCILPDDRGAAADGVARLVAAGHRRIAYLGASASDHFSVADRRDGYRAGMTAAGLPPLPAPLPAGDGDDARIAQIRQLLDGADRPSAVVTYSINEAVLLIHIAALLGLHVPRDLSVVSLGPALSDALARPICAQRTCFYGLGMRAVQMLAQRIAAPDTPLPPMVVPADPVEGDTIAPPNPAARP